MLVRVRSVGVVLSLLMAGPLAAQHLDFHGDHAHVHQNAPHGHDAAGHMVDSFGHHIDGHGNHTGTIGVFENGSTIPSYPTYPAYPTYPTYPTTPVYPSTVYPSSVYPSSVYPSSVYPSSVYPSSVPGTVVSTPVASAPTTVVTNRLPVPSAGPSGVPGGTIVLANPRTSGGSVRYTLNDSPYTINPGESQTLANDRAWVIKFDNGLSRQMVYRLDGGDYEFTVSPSAGWDVARTSAVAPALPAAPSVPMISGNTIPRP